ncbi:hypothetical protein SSX86_006962 [Deinandra increscens subsp. villosa]|uniref:F-box domain-containing protein n=1 Tax=Deinandra increscens subsp. villosa TaxID=3103831 RepID=A0AAP0DNL0_9ASTR
MSVKTPATGIWRPESGDRGGYVDEKLQRPESEWFGVGGGYVSRPRRLLVEFDLKRKLNSGNKQAITMSSKSVDRLSLLPEDILSQILSRMPTILAVRTSILSKRWRYSWMLVTNIDFDYDVHPIGDLYNLIKFVDRVLDLCKTSEVNLFRLRVGKFLIQESIMVSNWIEKAVRSNVHELDLQVETLELPVSLFTCKTLAILRLECSRPYDYDLCECRVNLPCLKTLDMVGLKNPFINISKLISGCPLLENLSFEVRWSLSYAYDQIRWMHRMAKEDYIFNIPTLKRLKITWKSRVCHINKVVLNVPNLEYLFVGGVLRPFIILENASSLLEACVSFSDIRCVDYHHAHPWAELLKGLSGVKSLSVQHNASTSLLPNFSNMTHLELKSCWSSIQIFHFLKNSPELEHLYIEKIEYSGWIKPMRVPPCMLAKLTTINLSTCNGQQWEIRFLEYMLGNAKDLKTLTITWENVRFVEEVRLREQLLAVPRASRYCEIIFLGSSSPSSPVKRARHAVWNNPFVSRFFNFMPNH